MKALKPLKTVFLSVGCAGTMMLLGLSVAHAAQTARVALYPSVSQKTINEAVALLLKLQQKQGLKTVKPIKTTVAASVAHAASVIPAKPALLPVVVQSDIKEHHQILADAVLRALPSGCRDNLKNFYVRYEGSDRRGLGGKTTIIVDGTVPDAEFIGLLTHECGHVIHSNLVGNPSSGLSAFADGKAPFYNDSPMVGFFNLSWDNEHVLRAGIKDTDFASGYAKTDAFENFAETFTLYQLHRPTMVAQAKTSATVAAQLQWMDSYMQPTIQNISTDMAKWTGTPPWDATKMSFKWAL